MSQLKSVFTQQNYNVHHEYDVLFTQLMEARDQGAPEALEPQFKNIISDYFATQPIVIDDLPTHSMYSRNYIGQDEKNNWQAMLSRWEAGATSTIHGHPDYILYYCVSGSFEMRFFELVESEGDNRTIRYTHTQILKPGETVASVGDPGAFDNLIHQVKALEPSVALHIFSDDALKGEVYDID